MLYLQSGSLYRDIYLYSKMAITCIKLTLFSSMFLFAFAILLSTPKHQLNKTSYTCRQSEIVKQPMDVKLV